MKADVLYWEKYRPKKFNSVIILPRIKKLLQAGIHMNMIFYGSPGTGKTTLARILSEEYDTLEINTSLFTSIEVLRGAITDHIKTLNFDKDPNGTKIIFLDEFERVSSAFQDALKGFTEEYSDYARFIFTTNHIEKIVELGSRFTKINFDPIDQEETTYLKSYYAKYLNAVVKDVSEESLIGDDTISKIVNKFFPDLRASVQMIQEITISRDITTVETSTANSNSIDLYNFILNNKCDVVENYKYVMGCFQSNPESAFKMLGRPFFTYLMDMQPEVIASKGGVILKAQKVYNETLNVTIDPIVHLLSYIYDLKQIIYKK